MRRGRPEPSRDSSQTCRCGAMFMWRIWLNGSLIWYWCSECDQVPPKKKKRRLPK